MSLAMEYLKMLRTEKMSVEGREATYCSHLMLTLDLIEAAHEQESGIEAVMNVIRSRMIFARMEDPAE